MILLDYLISYCKLFSFINPVILLITDSVVLRDASYKFSYPTNELNPPEISFKLKNLSIVSTFICNSLKISSFYDFSLTWVIFSVFFCYSLYICIYKLLNFFTFFFCSFLNKRDWKALFDFIIQLNISKSGTGQCLMYLLCAVKQWIRYMKTENLRWSTFLS